jgi:biotin synthase
MFNKFIEDLAYRVINGLDISKGEALDILNIPDSDIYDLLTFANKIRIKFCGDKISLCSIINAKSGGCGEDCAFCSQSLHHNAAVPFYPLMNDNEILIKAKDAERWNAHAIGIVISGKSIESDSDLRNIYESIRKIKRECRISPHASLGIITRDEAKLLKDAGLEMYHHNLETGRGFFPNICTTHDYEEDINTLRVAKEIGFKVCSGGIFGMGESDEDIVELAVTLKELQVDAIPLNFLHPIKGTRLENQEPLPPLKILKIISLFRFMFPNKDIKVCGGREVNIRDLQPLIFIAGANSIMIGNYLTTKGRKVEDDLNMLRDLNLRF